MQDAYDEGNKLGKIAIVLNDKITIIVNLQYRKGFLHWCRKEKEWKYYIILSLLIQIIKKGQVDYFVLLLVFLILKVEFGHVLLVSLATFT